MLGKRISLALTRRMCSSILQIRRRLAPVGQNLFDLKKGVLICGTGRSGTTWLGDLLGEAKGLLQYTEPFWEGGTPLQTYGITPHMTISPKDEWPEGSAFFSDLFAGRLLYQGWLEDATFRRAWRADAVVAKFIKAHYLLPWLVDHLEIAGFVLIVRHPCAVVASMMQHPNFRPQGSLHRAEVYMQKAIPHVQSLLNRSLAPHQCFAYHWAAEQHAVLPLANHPKVHLVRYEDLVCRGPEVLAELWDELNLPTPIPDEQRIVQPSREARAWSAVHDQASEESRLYGWKKRLTPLQVKDIMEIVSSFGIHDYDRYKTLTR